MTSNIIIFGEALVDIFPDLIVPGGAPFNVARHLAAFNVAPTLLTRLGCDLESTILRGEMTKFGLSLATIQEDLEVATGKVIVDMPEHGEHTFHIAHKSAYDYINLNEFNEHVSPKQEYEWVYSGTLALRHTTSREAYQSLINSCTAKRYVDLNWRSGHVAANDAWDAFRNADIAKLNELELAMLFEWQGLSVPNVDCSLMTQNISAEIASLLERTRISRLIVTYGASGYQAFDNNGHCLASGPGCGNMSLVDTVGAGDAFSAITLLGLLQQWPFDLTLLRANQFAAAICGIRGAVPIHLNFYHRWQREWRLAPYDADINLNSGDK